MNSPGGAAMQICSPQFDRRFFSLPVGMQSQIQLKIDELGCNLHGFSHHRMQGADAVWGFSNHLSVQRGQERIDFNHRWKQA